MDLIDRCPCCAGRSAKSWPAVIAPFIADFVLKTPVSPCKLLECDTCGFRFYDHRFTEAEAERLYSGYRGVQYFEARHRHEPWYTAACNAGLGSDEGVLDKRKRRMSSFLEKHLDRSRVESVLDYGGDSGQAIPEGWGTDRVVYELSDAAPVASVRKVSDAAQLQESRFDLIMLLHVLEHASEPAAMLERVRPMLRDRGVIFVEVPYERFSLRALGRGRAADRYVSWLVRHPRALRVVDFFSSAARAKLQLVPPLALLKLHEHINFFDERSLTALAQRCGFSTLSMQRQHFASASDPMVLVALLQVQRAV